MSVTSSSWGKVKKQMANLQKLQEQSIRTALTSAAFKISGDGAMDAPVKTGTLRRSITQFVRSDGMPTGKGSSLQIKVGSKLKYAKYQESGTRYIRAKKFLYNAIERNRKSITDLMVKAMRDTISKR